MSAINIIPEILLMPIIAALLASVTCGLVGTLTVVRRDTYVAGTVSHSILAGLGFSQFALTVLRWEWFTPAVGAITATIATAIIIVLFRINNERQDTALSAIWSVGMAIGLLFMAFSPGYQSDLFNYMFGTILLVSKNDIITMIVLNTIILLCIMLCWRGILAVCFNYETAKLRGVNVILFESALSIVTALSIVLLVRIMGVVLAVALLALPAMSACRISKRLFTIMFLTAVITAVSIISGLIISYLTDLPPSALTVTIAAIFVIIASIIKRIQFISKRRTDVTNPIPSVHT